MRRKLLSLLLAATIMCTGVSSNISANNIQKTKNNKSFSGNNYKYKSLEDVRKRINQAYKDDEISMSEHYDINFNTSPKVREQYMMEEFDRISNMDIDMTVSSDEPKKTYDLGNGTKITIEMNDYAEENVLDLGKKLTSLFITDVYAGSSEKTVTKEYGNRYCSQTVTLALIIGVVTFSVENHYHLGKNGITERYGSSAVVGSLSYGASVSIDDGVITDDVATKPGASNTNMYFKYTRSYSNFGFNMDSNGFIKSTLSYKANDTKNKTIKLTQKFTW